MNGPGGEAAGREVARQLLERDAHAGITPEARGAALQRTATRVLDDLASAVGADGLEALLARATLRAGRQHPAVATMRPADGPGVHLDIAAALATHGPEVTRAALEAVLAALVDILSALIGADMTRNLLHDEAR